MLEYLHPNPYPTPTLIKNLRICCTLADHYLVPYAIWKQLSRLTVEQHIPKVKIFLTQSQAKWWRQDGHAMKGWTWLEMDIGHGLGGKKHSCAWALGGNTLRNDKIGCSSVLYTMHKQLNKLI